MIARAIALCLVCVLPTGGVRATDPNKNMLEDPLEFTGVESPLSKTGEPIRIGLFCPDGPEHPVGRDMVRAANLAVDSANTENTDSLFFEISRRWDPDPWQGGAKVVTKLVFEDGVVALIGGPDGAATHVAQQVATKAHVPLIAPVSSDPSLTHTRVPWIFRLPPDDAQYAQILLEKAIRPGQYERVCLITSTDHDGRVFASEILDALQRSGITPRAHLTIPVNEVDFAGVVNRLQPLLPEALVVRLPRIAVFDLLEEMEIQGISPDVLLPWIPGLNMRSHLPAYGGEVTSTFPFTPPRRCGVYLKFVRAYTRRYGSYPPPEAVYTFDAIQLVINGVRRSGAGRTQVRRAVADIESGHAGASGPIAWDNGGGNTSAVPLLVGDLNTSGQSRPSR